ncbi:hypothetical protein BGW38_003316 [Lunasporangiospora selenospora]|uniref:Arrestin-like N-terminal domain-containing protein n=1 Tax=Lunasporangiospora selenospora TaxID=979761 RepID=A0A9P6G0M5_9FUNG|nr:hypothetical protein BGW38_003316 [Lunasporangiospora selenospora]
MSPEQTQAQAQVAEKGKELKLVFVSHGQWAKGEPVFIGSFDKPAIIRGQVQFSSNYECKGNDIRLHYKAQAQVKWTERRNNKRITYHGKHLYAEEDSEIALSHSKPGKINPGAYASSFEFIVDPQTPSTIMGTYGWMVYKVKATLVRPFPSLNIVREQKVVVLNSCIPPPQPPLPDVPMTMCQHRNIFQKTVPFYCAIPSNVIHVGQQVPITLKINPGVHIDPLASNPTIQVRSAVIKLKQYTNLSVRGGTKNSTKDIIAAPINDGWPAPSQGNWQRTVLVTLPDAPTLSPTMVSSMMSKTHKLKLIAQVQMGYSGTGEFTGSTKELRVEMDVTITGPRPAGDQYPVLDLQRYMAGVATA